MWFGHGPTDARFWTWQSDESEGLATVDKVLLKSSLTEFFMTAWGGTVRRFFEMVIDQGR